MASPNIFVSEGQFQCSICLDVLTDPVSTPCGHNFCLACIRGYWDSNNLPQCPLCKETFEARQNLCVNKSFAEIIHQFKSSANVKVNPSMRSSHLPSSEVFCDICRDKKLKAVKSCLACLTSYCEEHLSFHRFTKHRLLDPVNMEDRMCKQHERLLEVFCQNDQMCVCTLCAEKDHGTHKIVLVERAYAERMIQLGEIEVEVKQMIQERLKKVEEIKQTVELIRSNAKREIEDSMQVFTALVQAMERSQAKVIGVIEEKQRAAEKQAQGFIYNLELEISELTKRTTELEQLSHTQDHIHVLQSFPSMCTSPPTKNLSDIKLYADPCLGTVRKALSQLVELITEEEKTFSSKDLERAQKYAEDVSLDQNTAQPYLVLSVDRKQLRHANTRQDLPDNPLRFDNVCIALGTERLSCGRHYWEVEVVGKTGWSLGVARESVKRKGLMVRSPENGFWTLWLRNGQYSAFTDPPVHLSLNVKPRKVGIYLDYEEGSVSFYNVDAKMHVYTFADCSFAESLYAYFNPGLSDGQENAGPLVITPVVSIN